MVLKNNKYGLDGLASVLVNAFDRRNYWKTFVLHWFSRRASTNRWKNTDCPTRTYVRDQAKVTLNRTRDFCT